MSSDSHSGASIVPFPSSGKQDVSFNRAELDAILRVYGRGVASGEWRDYAIDHLSDRAVFSVFRRASEMPLYRVEKTPSLANKQGAYALLSASGHVLKRGRDLKTVVRYLENKLEI